MNVGADAARDLSPLFAPSSVAVVGASNDTAKWGNWLARGALRGAGRRDVHLVNRRGGEILGRPAFLSLRELPQPPELVVVTLPADVLPHALDEAIEAGARAVVAISAGREEGDAGGERDRTLAERAREAGVLLLGPNCLGVFDAAEELELVPNPFPAGSIGLLSQSGNLALEIALLAAQAGLGFSRFVSLGNQADLGPAELLSDLVHHEPTRLIALYCEDFHDGRAVARAARRAEEAGKPVILMTVSRSEATARAVRSHTGSLASDARAVEAVCRAAGVDRVRNPRELIDLAQSLLRGALPRGRRVGILADGGGHGAIAAEVALGEGLTVPALSESLVGRLKEELPRTAACANPIDLAGGGEQDVWTFARSAGPLLASGEVDAVIMTGYFGGYAEYSAELGVDELQVAGALAEAAAASGRPLVVHTMYPQAGPAEELRAGGVPVYDSIERAVFAVCRLAERVERVPLGVPALPPPAEPVDEVDYARARRLLAEAGLPFIDMVTVSSLTEAHRAAAEIGYPIVLKALGPVHKSDSGCVIVGLADDVELARAFGELEGRLAGPDFSVEQMANLSQGVELLVGSRWDERFGPIALAGLGGLYTQVFDDVAVGLAPLDVEGAERLILSLETAPLLRGARGRPRLDVAAAAEALALLSAFAAAHPEIAEVEVNPLLVLPRGALALDARIVLVHHPSGRS